ncbi:MULTISPECIES: hypothetical protein [Desulfococcus]|jgi:hypothetical protein|uniref:Uncharacterized protein n=1 Tax=Desulfococcus multivorans DSM 2059 TaxID=1121405 RepID=S7TGS0_DESML|nr:hypothetical protein [Desulfococcus multivorans]AOY59785.1 conserved uncharacterized protein [Desulfococcus multivorans]AQV01955.1 hypothetical protein B2D07_15110 [Desulfococcus multivorans]EPR35785.1 hypothetical protein dsmv_0490 [Desulfococcus multivorans DSM 2059]MDX9818826.1 hypothetical protein [Desulfococcus multivorans]SJZ33212.1 hypothetical protein SAMN02745446_00007 [Desulfococcus multivorans DSM 2059]
MGFWISLLLLMVSLADPTGAEEFDFIISEAQKKPYAVGGRLESRFIYHRLDEDAIRYSPNDHLKDVGDDTHEWRTSAELSGSCQYGVFQAGLLTHHQFEETHEDDGWDHKIYEGYMSLTPTPRLTVDAGKKSILWGKGYAWNPVGFINRPKDPDDPAQNLEGRTFLGVDLIRSFAAGHLSNIGVTALLLPVIDDWANAELGEGGDLNIALKLYLLWHDTDLDVICFDGPDQPAGFGFDFAKNLAENIEVHGELAVRKDVPHMVPDADDLPRESREDQISLLLGARYLNTIDTTFIAEYYHNGAGYDRGEIEDVFVLKKAAFREWQTTGDASVMERIARTTRPYDRQRNPGKDYGYIKISQKEPFDLLYFTPWVAAVVNLRDFSFNLQPGLTWAPVTDLELNLRVGIPIGPAYTEFGEKPDTYRPEVWVRYYF